MAEESLTLNQAYDAMYAFLVELYQEFGFDQLGGILGGMSLLENGTTADPAIWGDWLRAVEKAKQGQVDSKLRLK
jgi:hypothetical protein